MQDVWFVPYVQVGLTRYSFRELVDRVESVELTSLVDVWVLEIPTSPTRPAQ